MTKNKLTVKRILSYIILSFYMAMVSYKLYLFKGHRIFIFDIDNTISHSWYSFNMPFYKSNNERLRSLPIFIKMHRLIAALYKSPQNKVFFISARSISSYKTTYYWLKSNYFPLRPSDLMIVRKPADKLKIIRKIISKRPTIYFIDDHSFNHEKGEVKFYSEEINEIRLLCKKHPNLKYYGFYDIETFNHDKKST